MMQAFTRSVGIGIFLSFLLAGCAGGADPSETFGAGSEELKGGQGETERVGVIQLRFCDNADCSTVSSCTGIAIAPTVALTAGHCVSDYFHSGDLSHVRVQVRYKKDGRYRCVSGSDNGNGDCTDWHDSIVTTPFQGHHDSDTDIGKVSLVLGHADVVPFDLTATDFAYIYYDSMSYYGRLEGFGYGRTGPSVPSGILRSGTFAVDWYGSNHFITINRGASFCSGDSGGPMMVYRSQSGEEPQVVGLINNSEGSGTCGNSGGDGRSVRLSGWANWIENSGGPNNLDCTQIISPANGRKLLKCF